MQEILRLNLINLFTFYLAAIFLINTMRRLRQYHDVSKLIFAAPGRWPRVLQHFKKHGIMFFTWTTLRPAAFAITLLIVQSICSRLIWPTANLTLQDLINEWWMLPIVAIAAGAMLFVDGYFIVRVGSFDRHETEKYLDEAEHWLTSWKAPLISTVTFGYINPRKMVDTEVQKALVEGEGLLRWALWWVSIQASLRIFFGLTLWISWAIHPNISPLAKSFLPDILLFQG